MDRSVVSEGGSAALIRDGEEDSRVLTVEFSSALLAADDSEVERRQSLDMGLWLGAILYRQGLPESTNTCESGAEKGKKESRGPTQGCVEEREKSLQVSCCNGPGLFQADTDSRTTRPQGGSGMAGTGTERQWPR